MRTIAEMTERTASFVEAGLPGPDGLPPVPQHAARLLKEYKEANLIRQYTRLSHEIRMAQARDLGFELVAESGWDEKKGESLPPDLSGLLAQVAGPCSKAKTLQNPRAGVGWSHYHLDEKWLEAPISLWGGPPVSYRVGGEEWWLWHLGELIVPVPYGVMLKMAEARKTGLFNAFDALAPKGAFNSEEVIDPVVLAVQW